MVKISDFIIGMVLISIIVTILGFFMADLSSSTGVSYDNTSLSKFNKLDNITQFAKNLRDESGDIKEKTGVLDVIGSMFSSGYTVFKTTTTSFDLFNDMTDEAISNTNLGRSADVLRTGLTTIILILIFIGIILAAILKWKV